MRPLIRYFVQGALVLVPIVSTIYLIYWVVSRLDRMLPIGIPGLGLLIALAVITSVGFLVSNVVGARLYASLEVALGKVPVVRMVYHAIKDLAGAFAGDKKGFDVPVVVALPGEAGLVFGFQTREDLTVEGFPEHVPVYFPQSYNVAGNLIMVARQRVRRLDVARADFMSFIVSGGVSGGLHPHPPAAAVVDPGSNARTPPGGGHA